MIIDTESFSKNIKHTLFPREYNKLNTYFGAQTFEDWGLIAIVDLKLPNHNIETFISISEIKKINSNIIFFY